MTIERLNFSGGGVHEVAALVNGVLLAGHFSDPELADVVIAGLPRYTAAWSTLNALAALPDGRVLNPPCLTRGSRAGAKHISNRVSLLLDFDPPRADSTMSTATEHDAALAQARECRAWLQSLGWPLLPLCDSGSGAHLRPRVEMASDGESNRLVQRLLQALRHKFSFVDAGMWDLPRLCRYYGTWNRKSTQSTAERPWRESAVIESGDSAIITRAQIEFVIAKIGLPAPASHSGPEKSDPTAVDRTIRQLADWLDQIGITLTEIVSLSDGRTLLRLSHCPLFPTHRGSSAGIGVSVSGRALNMCQHSSCSMKFSEWCELVEKKTGVKLTLGRKLVFKTGAK